MTPVKFEKTNLQINYVLYKSKFLFLFLDSLNKTTNTAIKQER